MLKFEVVVLYVVYTEVQRSPHLNQKQESYKCLKSPARTSIFLEKPRKMKNTVTDPLSEVRDHILLCLCDV